LSSPALQPMRRAPGTSQELFSVAVAVIPARRQSSRMSIFKAGSTIPVKFQLKNAAGTPIQAASAPTFVSAGKVGLMTGAANSTATTDAADTGLTYRYGSSGQQYTYNWKSPKD